MLSRCHYSGIEHCISRNKVQVICKSNLVPALKSLLTLKGRRKRFESLGRCCDFATLKKERIDETCEPNVEDAFRKVRFPFQTKAGVILTRNPQITKLPTSFEKAFYEYQLSLEQRLAARFPMSFYFRKGSVAEKRWVEGGHNVLEEKKLLGQQKVKFSKKMAKAKSEDEESLLNYDDNVVPNDRITEADRTGESRSLERKQDRRLYLLIRKNREEHAWQFPQITMPKEGLLHESALQALHLAVGKNMNIWFVGEVPVCYHRYRYPEVERTKHFFEGAKVFFLRAHIFAGQAVPNGSDVTDFKWLTKEEIQEHVARDYWTNVRHALVDR